MPLNRQHWLDHVKDVIRSRHYTWLPRGLAGEPVDVAMTYLIADVMHVCKLSGISFEEVLRQARQQYDREEAAKFPLGAEVQPRHVLPDIDGDEVVTAFETNDVYEAEIIRSRLQAEGIACRVDSQSQGGFTELVEVKVLVHARDADRAYEAIHRRPSSHEPPQH